MLKKHLKHKFLLQKAKFVNECLGKESLEYDDFLELVISFCIVTEKILKIKLCQKNPVLAYVSEKNNILSDHNKIIAVATNSDKGINTLMFEDMLSTYKKVFPKSISDEEILAIVSVYKFRNHLIHSQKEDAAYQFDQTDIIKNMGNVWENRLQKITTTFFGKNNIKQTKISKKYSERELQEILKEEVRKMISSTNYSRVIYNRPLTNLVDNDRVTGYTSDVVDITSDKVTWLQANSFDALNGFSLSKHASLSGDSCPRCHNMTFRYGSDVHTLFRIDLWKCSICGLELTEKQYGIAKKL